MKQIPLSLRFILGFSLAGFFFSGYLTAVKLFSGVCAFNESCPIVFGYPACWYGFALYVILLSIAVSAARRGISFEKGIAALAGVSFVGIVFAGYLTMTELPTFLARGFASYTFGVPTCFMGLVFFMLIFVTSVLAWNHHRLQNN